MLSYHNSIKIIVFMVFISLSACQVAPNTAELSEDTRWLTDTSCRLPCWEGITPGKSTPAATLDRLDDLPTVEHASATQAAANMGIIQWSWKGSKENSGSAYYEVGSPSVEKSILSLNVKPARPIPLGKIIAQYGEPSHIWAGYNPGPTMMNQSSYVLVFYYKKYNFEAIWDEQSADGLMIDENTPISLITITDPDRDSFMKMDDQALKNTGIAPWAGFRSFHDYCVNLVDGGPCQK